jgi:two-component system, cell cycle response regulator
MIKEFSILIAEDDQGTCKIMANALTEAGYKVTSTFTGEEAIEKARKATFDVLITDLKLPGINGIEVLKKVKEGNVDICAIVVTAYASVDTAIRALEEGAYDYLTKPFDMEELKFVVGKGIERRGEYDRGEIDEFKVPVLDVLTQVYTREYFYRVVTREINRAQRYNQPVSLVLLELDDFVKYSQQYGTQASNETLKKVAQMISAVTRRVDFVFRYAETTFAVLLPETNREGGTIVARRLKNTVEKTKLREDANTGEKQMTVTIGLSVYSDDAKTKDELLAKSTECLHRAKESGKGKIFACQDNEIKEIN